LLQNFDVERIEVLRGPQGTLFGKNTTGGLINIIRGPITMEWGADVDVTLGQDGREDFKAVVNMPIIENTLGLKLFGASIQSDGYIKNTTLDRDVGGDDIQNYGFAALWKPTDNLDVKFHYEKFKDDSEQGAYHNLNQPGDLNCVLETIGLEPGGCGSSSLDDEDHNFANGTNFSNNDYDTFIVTANYQFENFLLTYIGSSRDMDENNMQHLDGSPSNFLTMDFFNEWHQKSHELRVTSQLGENVDIIAGLYLWDVEYEQRWDVGGLHYQLSRIGVWPFPMTPTSLNSNGQNQDSESKAAFVSADWRVTDKLTLTAGVRWTEEEKDFVGGSPTSYHPDQGDPIPPMRAPAPFKDKWDEITPKLGFKYEYNDDIMIFGSYSEGFKSGGFFGRQANFNIDPTYDPEFVESFELGMKSTLLDGRMTFNPTVFFSYYKDKQETISVPVNLANVATVVRNAASLEMWGIELEMQYQITEAWYLRATYGYIDAEFDDYMAGINGDGVITDNSGLTTRNTPENTFGLTTSYTIPIGEGDLQGLLSYRWRDEIEMFADNAPFGHLDDIDDLSATLTYSWADAKYRISAYGRNLTDERERKVYNVAGLSTASWWNEGRVFGVEMSASF
ncbi:MAG: TonB-dependent receptor, partial [Pseudomonadales bacterium]|nr:TonB-dependent receptor [Pseudomonadales bacterium]